MTRLREQKRTRRGECKNVLRSRHRNLSSCGDLLALSAGQSTTSLDTRVQSCRLSALARATTIDVLTKLDSGWPMRRIAELVPYRWALERGCACPRERA